MYRGVYRGVRALYSFSVASSCCLVSLASCLVLLSFSPSLALGSSCALFRPSLILIIILLLDDTFTTATGYWLLLLIFAGCWFSNSYSPSSTRRRT